MLFRSDLQEIQAKLQASLAISNALTTIHNSLQQESALMIGIATIQKKASVVAENLDTAAKGKNIIATTAATVAQKVFNAVAKANPYVLLATAILTVVGALVAYTQGSKKAAEEEAKRQEEAEKAKKAQEDMARALGSATGSVEAKYRSLQKEWGRLKTESEKSQWIKDHASDFKSLGLAVRSVSDAEKVLVEMAPQVIAALKAVAKASAFEDLYVEAIQKKAKEWDNRKRSLETGDLYYPLEEYEKYSLSPGFPEEWTKASLEADVDYTELLGYGYKLTQKGVLVSNYILADFLD